jgi:endonuclease/exonuclease/phosphatase family metal-dependent hydrolase
VPIRILSLNLWHDSGPWPERAACIRSWVERLDPDVIGFQEVLNGGGFDLVADVLGEERLPHRVFGRASPFWREGGEGVSFGNAIASRWPIAETSELKLPDAGDGETRAAITAAVQAPVSGDILSVTCTHLHWKLHDGAVRERQVVALADHVLAQRPRGGFPPVVVGDFNAEPDSDEIRYLQGLHSLDGRSVLFYDAWRLAGDDGPGTTWSNRNAYAVKEHEPNRRIDYIFTGYPTRQGEGRIESCRVVCDAEEEGVWPSDHFGVFAELAGQPDLERDRARG